MHLLGYDYFADRHDNRIGLAGLADLIEDLRSEHTGGTLLFDNGDFLQGNPLADTLAATLGTGETQPMIAAMNCLHYDGITLGNHEFDYGLPFLRRTLCKLRAPVVSANINCSEEPALASPFCILTRDIICDDGIRRAIKIGVTGFAPPQVAASSCSTLPKRISVEDIIGSANQVIPRIKAAGADLVVALCHSGIGAAQESPLMENAALPLASVEGLDVLLIGHSHEQFPDPDGPTSAIVDPIAGTLHAKPAVMAGFYGTSLGVIALDLGWTEQGWRMQSRSVRLQKPTPRRKSAQRREIELLAANAHTATLAHIRTPIAQTVVPIQNYFATVQPDLTLQLLAQAMRDALPENLRQTPVVAAVSPFQFGGRNGLGHFIDIPAGQVTLRDAAAIFPFAYTLWAVRRSGAQIRDWLERSAAHYNQINPHTHHQSLMNPRSAGYHCDALYGLTYDIDLSQPARFDVWGKQIIPSASRIRDSALDGKPVADDDVIIVAANSFRASGGGGFAAVPEADVLWRTREKLSDISITALQKRAQITNAVQPVWRFCPIAGAHAQFQSVPQAKEHIANAMRHIGAGDNGFETYSLVF